jgi:hypothetical protein
MDVEEEEALVLKVSYDELVAQELAVQEQLDTAEASLSAQPVDPLDPDYDADQLEELNDRVESLREDLKVPYCKHFHP